MYRPSWICCYMKIGWFFNLGPHPNHHHYYWQNDHYDIDSCLLNCTTMGLLLLVQHTEPELITRYMVWAPSFLLSSAGGSIFKTSGFQKPWHLRIPSFFESWKAINSFWMWTTFSECGWTFNFQCPALEISSPHLRVLALNNSYLGEVITNFFLLCVL